MTCGLLRQHDVSRLSAEESASWTAAEHPLRGVHQFSLAGLPPLLRIELVPATAAVGGSSGRPSGPAPAMVR